MDFTELYEQTTKHECPQLRTVVSLFRNYTTEQPAAKTTAEDWLAAVRVADANAASSQEYWDSVMSVADRMDMPVAEYDWLCPFCERPYCSNAHRFIAVPAE